jgi:ssDNA thymidine ADP-ribosyltransferase, DarT
MAIPPEHKHRYAYHFTSIENLDSILKHGLISTNQKNRNNINHADIAKQNIQIRRSTMEVPCAPGTFVHDYVPFYFAKRTPMQLSVINSKNIDQQFLIYFAVNIDILDKPGCIFTDASANTSLPPTFYNNPEYLLALNWDIIDCKKWGYSEIEKHLKMAELLVYDSVPLGEIAHIIAYNKSLKAYIVKMFVKNNLDAPFIQLDDDDDHYFTAFADGRPNDSLVTGPYFLKSEAQKAIKRITSASIQKTTFPNIESALASIAVDFNCIKELSEIVGLIIDNPIHHEDVATHTISVVKILVDDLLYKKLSIHYQQLVTLAAYLHDIGKGPKSRWLDGVQTVDSDHPRRSLKMLERILMEDIGNLSYDDVRRIVTLVTYDDLVGEIVGKGRHKQQLFDIIEDEMDVFMLFLINRADTLAICQEWISKNQGVRNDLAKEAICYLRAKGLRHD